MVSDDHVADARLDLGLGCCGGDPPGVWKTKRPFRKHGTGDDHSITCLTLGLPDEVAAANQDVAGTSQQTSSSSGGFSFSNSSGIKRSAEKVEPGDEEVVERVPSRVMNDVDDEVDEFSPRKKLRLSKEQSTVLEESFKMHSTLNTRQKQDLANQLNLRPRQVEVWFQNRRARTKLKQTEVECEMLKKCCETLREENVKLRKEVQELKLMKQTMLPYRQVHASALALCPSCERISGGHPEFPFSKGSRHWPNQAAHPSAAC